MEEKNTSKVVDKRMKEASFIRNYYVVTVEEGTTRKDLLRADFWSLVAVQFQPFDRVEVRIDDGSFFAEYIVLTCNRTFAKLHELSFIDLSKANVEKIESDMEEYEVKYKGAHNKWSVIRKSDNNYLVKELDSKANAMAWLTDHMKAVA